MTDRKLALFLAWIIPLIFMMVLPFSVNDLAGWIAHGLYFLQHHEILRHDIFSVLPTSELVYPSWRISVTYALLYQKWGLEGVCVFHVFFLSVLLFAVYKQSLLQLADPGSRVARYATYIFWLGGVAAFGERPSMIALLVTVLAFGGISKIESSLDLTLKKVAWLCLLQVVWVNLHGSFVLLWMMLAWKTFFVMKREGAFRWVGVHVCVLLSTLVNPFTYRVYPYILETLRSSRARMFSEWAPTTLWAYFPTGLLFWALMIVTLGVVIRRFRKPGFREWISSPFFLILISGLFAIRNAALPFIVLLPALKQLGYLDTPANSSGASLKKISNIFVCGFFCLIFVAVSPPFKPKIGFLLPPSRRDLFDRTATFTLADQIQETGKTCPIFNSSEVGSFLMLKLPNRIFFDARNVIYSEQEFRSYVSVTQAQPGWSEYLDRYHACFAVLDPEFDSPLIAALKARSDWRLIGEEKGVLLFAKS